jgi:chorismate mutase
MAVRGVRGATVVEEDRSEAVLSATKELLLAVLKANPDIKTEDLASAWFTVSDDIHSVYPARAAREIGWNYVPLMCSQEMPVTGSLPHCIRVLLSWNTELSQKSIRHVYLGAAASLRPDLNLAE